jgi:hypothetical protein
MAEAGFGPVTIFRDTFVLELFQRLEDNPDVGIEK